MPPADAVRVFHFADVHLGVENYGRFNPETGLNTRLEDFTRSLESAVDTALDSDIDIALFAGDAYKARDPNQTHQRAFAHALKRLTDAGVPVALCIGNHDIPNTRGRAHALEIYGLLGGAGVTIFSTPRLAPIATRKGEVLVGAMPYLTRSRVLTQDETKGKTVEEIAFLIRDRYVDYVAALAEETRAFPDHIALLMGHFTVADARVGVQSFLLNPNEPQVPAAALALPDWDYVALGHIHKHQEMNRGAQPPVVYPGSIDRIDFGERGEVKGFVLADVVPGNAVWRHVPLNTRPFLEIVADAGDGDDPTAALIAALGQHPLDGAIVRVTYRASADQVPLIRDDELRRALAPASCIVAVLRETPNATALTRTHALGDAVSPEQALGTFLDLQPRLAPRKDELLAAARPLFDELAQEDAE